MQNQYTSTTYTQLQSCDKGKYLISSWGLFLKIIICTFFLRCKNTVGQKTPFLHRKLCEKPKHCISTELALQTPYVSYYCQCASRKRQSKTIQPDILPTPSLYWKPSIQGWEAEHMGCWGAVLGWHVVGMQRMVENHLCWTRAAHPEALKGLMKWNCFWACCTLSYLLNP